MYAEEDFVLISALQHYVFCPRQCGLIHVERAWEENLYTARGEIFHHKVDTDSFESRGIKKTVRGMRIHSYQFGITGRCDVVEFHETEIGLKIIPVEYKSGKSKKDFSDKVQLCAQTLCLEEMLHVEITEGAFFYGTTRRREKIEIDEELRVRTNDVISTVRHIVNNSICPLAKYTSKCRNCSLRDICQPKALNTKKLRIYISELFKP